MNILSYLDEQIEGFKQKKEDYPSKIIVSKQVYDKIFSELELEPQMDCSWKDGKDNYRGIILEIKDIEFLKLEG